MAARDNPTTRLIGAFVCLASAGSLFFQFVEPFTGTWLAYAGRLLGPLAMLLVGGHLFLQRRPHPLVALLTLALAALSLVFVVVGFRH
jgi:hypothetical protein